MVCGVGRSCLTAVETAFAWPLLLSGNIPLSPGVHHAAGPGPLSHRERGRIIMSTLSGVTQVILGRE